MADFLKLSYLHQWLESNVQSYFLILKNIIIIFVSGDFKPIMRDIIVTFHKNQHKYISSVFYNMDIHCYCIHKWTGIIFHMNAWYGDWSIGSCVPTVGGSISSERFLQQSNLYRSLLMLKLHTFGSYNQQINRKASLTQLLFTSSRGVSPNSFTNNKCSFFSFKT